MKFVGESITLMTVACLNAQTPVESPPIQLEELRQLLNQEDSDLSKLARGFLGEGDTNRFFYFPTRDQPATPAKWNFRYDDVMFQSGDGTRLHGWFLKAKGEKSKGTVVFSHGNSGSIGHHLGFVLWLVEAGYQVFTYDYRGFGKSGGELDRRGMIEDVQAAFRYVAQRSDVDASKLISYGHSLGGAKSLAAFAAEKPVGLQAIIVDGAFASYRAMAVLVAGQLGAEIISDELSPKDLIQKITGTPLLVVHGDEDRVVPFLQGQQLFDLANEPKTFFKVADGGHGDSLVRDQGAYRKKMLLWLDQES